MGRTSPPLNPGVEGDVEVERTRNSSRYLLATVCYDLGLYGEAEEALLGRCREVFREVVRNKKRGKANEVMDAWILETVVSICIMCSNLGLDY